MKKNLNNIFVFYKNNWFKINIIMLLLAVAIFIYKFSLNVRYLNIEGYPNRILDSRTGKIYIKKDNNVIEEHEFIQNK